MNAPLPRLALSARQPKAYLAGCLKGDACITAGRPNSIRGYLQLRVADWDFADAFSEALRIAYGIERSPKPDERGYAFIRTYNGHGRFDELRDMNPSDNDGRAAWMRGLFDSEGNVVCVPKPKKGPNSWDRRVAIFSTTVRTLEMAHTHLASLGIEGRIVPWASSAGHLGTLPVFALSLTSGRENFDAFSRIVGSSIKRKSDGLRNLPTTYCPDLGAITRRIQKRRVENGLARKAIGGKY